MEGICINKPGQGFFKLVMDMPALRPNSGNPAWEIHQIFIWPSLNTTISGSFKMIINGLPLLLNFSPNLSNLITAEQIAYLLNRFY